MACNGDGCNSFKLITKVASGVPWKKRPCGAEIDEGYSGRPCLVLGFIIETQKKTTTRYCLELSGKRYHGTSATPSFLVLPHHSFFSFHVVFYVTKASF